MALYVNSTQHQHWKLSVSLVTSMEREVHEDAVSYIREMLLDASSPIADADRAKMTKHMDSAMTFEEAQQLKRLCLKDISKRCQDFGFHSFFSTGATALAYFNRFYTKHSVLEYNPYSIAIACIYLASKAEESWIRIEELSERSKLSPLIIAEHELFVLDGIDFHLRVHHPYRPLKGFINLLKAKQVVGGRAQAETTQICNEVLAQATKVVDLTTPTNLLMFYTPPQIALACLLHCLREMAQSSVVPQDIEERLWDLYEFQSGDNVSRTEELKETVEKIISVILQEEGKMDSHAVDVKLMTELMGKWKIFHDPTKNPESQTFKNLAEAQLEEDDREQLEEERRKTAIREERERRLLQSDSMDLDDFKITTNL
eukprot:TRINITY_DN4709_c0_g1_i2.p2 TRINITY_DN4709_c0_g1~~TRINITY_DN4709_c0_g1_i2.p2  ORF type:complete len:372 (-),score=114.52 TRINITY_DN4709_c0_g1_i2:194-1309(-)